MAKRITNEELEELIREYSLVNNTNNQLAKELKQLKGKIIAEFNKRKITEYKGKTISCIARRDPVYDYFDSVLEDYSLDQLHEMGALTLVVGKFQKGSGLSETEMKAKYQEEVGKKAPTLDVTPKPTIRRNYLKELKKIFSYPTSE